MKRYIIRQESFGATIYDRLLVSLNYLDVKKVNKYLSCSKILLKSGDVSKHNSTFIPLKNPNINYLAAPEKIFIELTKKCNLRCSHCFNESGKTSGKEWDWTTLKKVLDECVSIGVFKIRFTGGEPILSKYLFDALRYCKKNGITTSIGTNATLMNDDIARKLKSAGLDMAVVSIDGVGEIYESIRLGAKYKDFIRGLDSLVKSGIKVRLNMTLMKQNYDQIRDVIDLAIKKKVGLYIRRLIPIGRADINNIVSQDKYFDAVNLIESHKESGYNFGIHYEKSRVDRFDNDILNRSKKCSCGVRGLAVTPSGEVYGCGLFVSLGKKYSFGNLNKRSIESIWHESEKLKKMRKKVEQTYCIDSCERKDQCLGSCQVMTEISRGKDFYCDKYRQ